MIKIYYVPSRKITREYLLIKQGLENNPRVELVDNIMEDGSDYDFIFLFYTTLKHEPELAKTFLPERTVFIDYHDKPCMIFDVGCRAYFKRSWVELVDKRNHTTKRVRSWPSNFHPISLAIMDEFVSNEDIERDVALSCTIRPHKRHPNRPRVLNLIKKMNISGKTQIGELNQGTMKRFNDADMKEYFRLLKRSRIVVTCNPGVWEGDHRLWEALANGALVFVDRMYVPMRHPLVDRKHCIFYDLSDEGLKELQETLWWFLEDPESQIVAEQIAKEGHDFAMKHHRTSNRIDDILRVIT